MEALILLFSIALVIGVGVLIWLNTRNGRKWLASL